MSKSAVNPYKKLPIVGPWISRIGHVIDIFATPCSPSPEIWVKAAFISSPRLAYLLVKPFLLATEWHIRTSTNHRKLKGIARLGAEFTPQFTGEGRPGWVVFKNLGDLILKIEWYFMIIDRTTEFAVNWTSLAYSYQGCLFPDSIWFEGKMTGGVMIPNDDWTAVGPFWFDNYRGEPGYGGFIGIPRGYSGVAKLSTSVTPDWFLSIPPCKNYEFRVLDILSGLTLNQISGSGSAGEAQSGADATFTETYNEPGHVWICQVRGDRGALYINEIDFGAHGFHTGTKGLTFDP